MRRLSPPWREVSFAVLDFETTGLDLPRDHVLSFGVVPIDRGRIRLDGALYRVVRPPVPVPAKSIRVHGIRPVEVEDAPALEEVAAELLAALEGRTVVGYAAAIELAFLRRLRRRRAGLRPWRALDVVDLNARLTALTDSERPGLVPLADLAAQHGVPVGRTHHAFADALTTAQLFLVLAARLERRGAGRLRDLARR